MTSFAPDTSPYPGSTAWELEESADFPDEARAVTVGYTAVKPSIELSEFDPDSATDPFLVRSDEDFGVAGDPMEEPAEQSLAEIAPALGPQKTSVYSSVEIRAREVLDDAIAGDPQAVGELMATVRPAILRYCRNRLRNLQDAYVSAEDATQEACLAIATALPNYTRSIKPFTAFVYGIAQHKVADIYRLHDRQPRRADLDRLYAENAWITEQIADAAPTPEQHALSRDGDRQLVGLLDHLEPSQKTAVLLRLIGGYSGVEAAEMMGISPGNVRITQFRALQRIRELIDPDELSERTLQISERKRRASEDARPSPPVSNVLRHIAEAMPRESTRRAQVIAEYAADERNADSTAQYLGISTAAVEKYLQQFKKLKSKPPKTA